jgi:antitoxin CptB
MARFLVTQSVMPGLDPDIHPSSRDDGLPGQARNDDTVDNSRNTGADIRHLDRYINPARHRVRAFGVLIGIGKMTGSTRSSDGLDDRRKRLLFRCWHRGTREMDLILGRFADAEIAGLSDDELAQLELLIEVPDPDLYAAVSGNAQLAAEYAGGLFDRIKSFRSTDHA